MIDAHCTHLRYRGRSENTIRDAAKLLRRLDRELPAGLPVATLPELEAWLAHNPNWSAQTRETYRLHMVRFFRWAVRPSDPWVDDDQCTKLEPITVPASLPRPALTEHVRAACTQLPTPWRYHCILAAYAGLRPCEIARLRREDVTEQVMYVMRGKGGKRRAVPTHPVIWTAVAPLRPGLITYRHSGATVTPAWVSQRTADQLHKHDLPITLYNLRHWFATRVQEGQGDLRVTQELMGHSSPNTTSIYTQVVNSRGRAAVATLPRLVD
ncbi:tyrosine-type recombinase/integrase [Micromonospora sp. 4G55]|uniref:tyrosine-type recombinase/integrase n=1 Tax=Micromonospora sp. 4G55 TaxID=2806102 RepID=UPI001EE4D47D|nr:tyrosine-type recombinase/integrase [Micromonospora sp. 4G55]